ncbi:MAG TPA: lauroyl acyltransferase [Roseiarcus sp.]|jgi:KDO2-lipid IV(A) lauroyltransferase
MSRIARARQYSEYLAFRSVAALIGALPLELASRWCGAGWRLVAPHLPRHQRALDNLARAFPEATPAERERIALAMWNNLGRTFAEFFHIQRIVADGRIALEPFERFEEIAKRPFIVCTLHMGNWEILSQAGLRFGLPLAGVYQRLTNPYVDEWLLKVRSPLYPGGLFDKSPATARALLKLARDGGFPAFVSDLRERRGLLTPFFGQPARSNPFPALIARVTGLPLYAARTMRLPDVRFTVRIERIEVPETDDRDADVLAATTALQAQFEEFVREAPEQWMWAHRRWD